MSKYIKCTDDYCYVLNKQDTLIFDSVDDLLYRKFDINKGGYKQDLVITVYTKKIVKASECSAFDVEYLLEESDCIFEEEYDFEDRNTYQNMKEEDKQELKCIINNFLDERIKTGVFITDDFVGYIVLTKDILNDGKPIDGRKFQIHKTYPSIV
ncbi:hypothetical protein [Snodgrassella alvi]|uniref:hypothetical protein n=1 Tax=Snodgrassella alvi TaxID=1196083 RepID=UPI003460AD0E